MNVDGVKNGIVIDHIKAGMSMSIYKLLSLDKLDCCVAVIQNVESRKYGRKDIIKIDEEIDIDMDVLGYLDPSITVNIVKSQKLYVKKHLELPRELRNVVTCKNPRCITTVEPEADQVFRLVDRETKLYRCMYCEAKAKGGD